MWKLNTLCRSPFSTCQVKLSSSNWFPSPTPKKKVPSLPFHGKERKKNRDIPNNYLCLEKYWSKRTERRHISKRPRFFFSHANVPSFYKKGRASERRERSWEEKLAIVFWNKGLFLRSLFYLETNWFSGGNSQRDKPCHRHLSCLFSVSYCISHSFNGKSFDINWFGEISFLYGAVNWFFDSFCMDLEKNSQNILSQKGSVYYSLVSKTVQNSFTATVTSIVYTLTLSSPEPMHSQAISPIK